MNFNDLRPPNPNRKTLAEVRAEMERLGKTGKLYVLHGFYLTCGVTEIVAMKSGDGWILGSPRYGIPI